MPDDDSPAPELCPELSSGLPPGLGVGLRREVGLLRAAERRRRFPMGVHVGVPGARRHSTDVPWPVPDAYDAGLRLDLLDALLAGGTDTGEAAVQDARRHLWLTRPGIPEQHDQDLRWWGSARKAMGARELPLAGFHVVTRYGWLDLGTGASRAWKRLRL